MKIRGLEKLDAQLQALANADYVPALEKGVREAILPEMQSLTAIDTGELKDSEGVAVEGDKVVLFADADHAVFIELGTSNMEAQPFMRPAIDAKSDEALKIAAQEVNKIMEKSVK